MNLPIFSYRLVSALCSLAFLDCLQFSAQGADILFVTRWSQRDSVKLLNILTAQGHTVTVHDTDIDGETLFADEYEGTYDLLMLDEVVNSGDVGNRWRNSPIPVVSWEGFLYSRDRSSFVDDELDGGTDPEGDAAYGQVTDEQFINIILPDHPLAAGLPAGTIGVWDPDGEPVDGEGNGVITFSGGSTFIPDAIRVATVPDFDDRFCVFGVEAGTRDMNGETISARWVHLPWNNSSASRIMIEPSFFLYEAAIAWALGLPEPTKIHNLTPQDGVLLGAGTSSISFAVDKTTHSESPVPQTGVQLFVNEVDVSAELTITDDGSQWNASYGPLEADKIYSIVARATAEDDGTSSRAANFDTFDENSVILVDAEDFNFESGGFIDNPVFCNDRGGGDNCYFDRISEPGIDALDTLAFDDNGNGDNAYRFDDDVDTIVSRDFVRPRISSAPEGEQGTIRDYDIETLETDDWQNYTRTIEDGTYFAYLRASAAADQEVELGIVTDPTEPTQTVETIGRFTIAGSKGYHTIPLTEIGTNTPKAIEAGGIQTFRLTTVNGGGGLRLNYFFLNNGGAGDSSPFEINQVDYLPGPPARAVITWPSSDGQSFIVEQASDLQQWVELADDHPSAGETTTFEANLPDPVPDALYLRVTRK